MKRPVLKYCLSMLFCCLMAQISFSQARGEEEPVKFDFKCAKIISTTEVTVPSNRNRVKLGVGEMVVLRLEPNKGVVEWEITSGTASFEKTTVTKTVSAEEPKLYIGENAGKVKVKAKIENCSGYPAIEFTIVVPDEINFDCGTYGFHRNGYPSAGITAKSYLFPDDVSFYNLEYQEQEKVVTVNSPYFGNLTHKAGSWIPCKKNDIKIGFGTPLEDGYEDEISICGANTFVENAGQGGDTSCDIPVKFRIKDVLTIIPNTNVTNLQETNTFDDGGTIVRKEDVRSRNFPMGYPLNPKSCACTMSCLFICSNCCVPIP